MLIALQITVPRAGALSGASRWCAPWCFSPCFALRFALRSCPVLLLQRSLFYASVVFYVMVVHVRPRVITNRPSSQNNVNNKQTIQHVHAMPSQ